MKRIIDVVGALVGLALLGPIMLVVGLAVEVSMGSPVLFRHRRPGRGGRPFTVYKFRTMRPVARLDPPETDEERLTPLGRFLRKTSLDELPQLWNVLRGDMSLVGPRPLLMEYLRHYSPEQARRHLVRPGITGWAQVHGRNALPFPERLALDVWYVDNRSLRLDAKIIALTLLHVARPSGIDFPPDATFQFSGESSVPAPAGRRAS